MIIGSHNSMSYCKAKNKWLRPFTWMARCQKVDLNTQFYKYGVRYFDLRVHFTKGGRPEFRHGEMVWAAMVYSTIQELDQYAGTVNEPVYVRIILEQNMKSDDQVYQDKMFYMFCNDIQKWYDRLIFVGGRRKYDWELLYDFHTEEPTLDDKYSSTTNPFGGKKNSIWAKIDDIWPWLYAKIHNKKNYKNGTDKDVLFLDFVNIR